MFCENTVFICGLQKELAWGIGVILCELYTGETPSNREQSGLKILSGKMPLGVGLLFSMLCEFDF